MLLDTGDCSIPFADPPYPAPIALSKHDISKSQGIDRLSKIAGASSLVLLVQGSQTAPGDIEISHLNFVGSSRSSNNRINTYSYRYF